MPFCPSIFPAKFFSSAVLYFFVSIETWGVVGLLWFVGAFLFWFVFGWLGFCVFFCLCVGFLFVCFNFPLHSIFFVHLLLHG